MPIPTPLEFVIERLRRDDADVERRMLRKLSGVDVRADEARSVWPRILDHKWYMSERMGRDVGLRVAAIDFLEHVEPELRRAGRSRPTVIRLRAIGRVIVLDPVVWLNRVLRDFTETMRGVSVIVGGFL